VRVSFAADIFFLRQFDCGVRGKFAPILQLAAFPRPIRQRQPVYRRIVLLSQLLLDLQRLPIILLSCPQISARKLHVANAAQRLCQIALIAQLSA
jgi:hypothetical protein